MIEQMGKQMDAESAADEKKLRERILETETILAGLLVKYIETFGATPWAMNLDTREGAQFVAVEDDRLDQLAMERMDGESQPHAIDVDNAHDFVSRESQIEQYEAGPGFADSDPDGMS